MKTVTPSSFARSKTIVLILLFALGSGTIVGCMDIHPDNSPHSPMGHGR